MAVTIYMPPRTKQSAVALAVLIVLCTLFYIGDKTRNQQTTTTSLADKKETQIHSIEEIKEIAEASSTYQTQGYVVGKYGCPSCPLGATCQRCPVKEEAVIIDGEGLSSPRRPLAPSQIVLITKEPSNFHLGQKYRFSIILEPASTTASSTHLKARILDYQLIN